MVNVSVLLSHLIPSGCWDDRSFRLLNKTAPGMGVDFLLIKNLELSGIGPHKHHDATAAVELGDHGAEDRQLQVLNGQPPGLAGRRPGRHPRGVVRP
jgi:hypothetical protein